ncbi:MAG: hypothetical protein EOO04_12395 [Chitinophagaceae bacterium]|nr:MAG: hypothetical protein EOO04_12395 [Chitinophagaceae bacterium]
MEDNIFDIKFDYNGLHYEGWANPSSKKNSDGEPASYHVVLNDISFGNISFNQGKWINSEDRPDELIALVGKHIEQNQMKK